MSLCEVCYLIAASLRFRVDLVAVLLTDGERDIEDERMLKIRQDILWTRLKIAFITSICIHLANSSHIGPKLSAKKAGR